MPKTMKVGQSDMQFNIHVEEIAEQSESYEAFRLSLGNSINNNDSFTKSSSGWKRFKGGFKQSGGKYLTKEIILSKGISKVPVIISYNRSVS